MNIRLWIHQQFNFFDSCRIILRAPQIPTMNYFSFNCFIVDEESCLWCFSQKIISINVLIIMSSLRLFVSNIFDIKNLKSISLRCFFPNRNADDHDYFLVIKHYVEIFLFFHLLQKAIFQNISKIFINMFCCRKWIMYLMYL